MPKEKFGLFTCRRSHFSLTGGHTFHLQGSKKFQKKVRTFYLKMVKLFTCRGPKNSKRKFALFTCRWSHFSLTGSGQMPKVRTFHLQGSHLLFAEGPKKVSKESSHFLLAGRSKKCQRKVHTCYLQGVQKNATIFWSPVQVKNFLSTLTTSKACLSAAHHKLTLFIHTEHKQAVAR